MAELHPGTQISGYQLLSFIGKGGMGSIWLARQTSIDRDVALKILSSQLVKKDPAFADRFIKEAQAAGRLSHSHIIAVHDVGHAEHEGETVHYFSMEYVDGENFRTIVDRDGACPDEMIGKIMDALSDALAYAHGMGMIHRDIKPENVMITNDGRVKLADFGLAMRMDQMEEVERDQSGRIKVMGTPLYMSPEQARGRPLDHRSDQYSLGATLFHLLTGRPPYRKPNSRDVMRAHVNDPVPDPADHCECEETWRWLCMRLMAKDPSERFASSEDLRQAVQDILAGQIPAGMRRRMAITGAGRRQGGRQQPIGLIATGVAVLLFGLGIVLLVALGGDEAVPIPGEQTQSSQGDDDGPGNAGVDIGNQDAIVRRARQFINRLPSDEDQALAEIRGAKGLGNSYFATADRAMALLRKHERSLAERVHQRHEELYTKISQQLDAARSDVNAGRIPTARGRLEAIRQTPNMDLKPFADDLEQLTTAISAAVTDKHDEIRQMVATADNHQVLQQAHQQLQAHRQWFDATQHQELARAIQEREQKFVQDSQQVQQDAEKEQRDLENDASYWQRYVQRDVANIRDVQHERPEYEDLVRMAKRAQKRLDTARYKAMADELIAIGQRAIAIEKALQAYLGEQPYRHRYIDEYGHLTGFNGAAFIYKDSQIGTRILVEKEPSLLRDVIEQMRKDVEQGDVGHVDQSVIDEVHEAAFCWLLDLKRGEQLLTGALRGHPQTDIIARLDPDISDALGSYDFAGGVPGWEDIFLGEDLQRTASSLYWTPQQQSPVTKDAFLRSPRQALAQLRIDHMQRVQYRHQLRPPCTIQIRCLVEGSTRAVFGFTRDDTSFRLMLQNTSSNPLALIPDTGERLSLKGVDFDKNKVTYEQPVQVELHVDAGGQVRASINGSQVPIPEQDRVLDSRGPCTFVIENLQLGGEQRNGIHLYHIAIEGERVRR